jgi:hypothetical protein
MQNERRTAGPVLSTAGSARLLMAVKVMRTFVILRSGFSRDEESRFSAGKQRDSSAP